MLSAFAGQWYTLSCFMSRARERRMSLARYFSSRFLCLHSLSKPFQICDFHHKNRLSTQLREKINTSRRTARPKARTTGTHLELETRLRTVNVFDINTTIILLPTSHNRSSRSKVLTSTTNVIDMELNLRTRRMVYEFGSALRQRPPGCMKIGPGIGPIFVSKVYETPQAAWKCTIWDQAFGCPAQARA